MKKAFNIFGKEVEIARLGGRGWERGCAGWLLPPSLVFKALFSLANQQHPIFGLSRAAYLLNFFL